MLVEKSDSAGELGTWRVCMSGDDRALAEVDVEEREGEVLVRCRLLGEGRVDVPGLVGNTGNGETVSSAVRPVRGVTVSARPLVGANPKSSSSSSSGSAQRLRSVRGAAA